MKYKTKPVEIDAMQYDGTRDSYYAMKEHWGLAFFEMTYHYDDRCKIHIESQEKGKTMLASKDDFIIKDTEGNFSACKPSVFHKKYEPV
jgi:hypothetical protein